MTSADQHLVLVDDLELNLRTYSLLLERLPNVDVHCFTSSAAALAWSAEHDADCFVVDYHMPAPDGIEVARRLRQNPATWFTPIIMVTGERERRVRYAALDAGVNDFIEKPVDPREFVSRIKTFLELHAARKRIDGYAGDLSASLRIEEQRSREHAGRLEALWHVTTDPLIGGDEMLGAVLTQSAAAVRPGEDFVARLFRLDGDEAVIEGSGLRADATGISTLGTGARVPLAATNLGLARERGAAIAWDDIRSEPALRECRLLHEFGIISQIAAPIRVAGTDYVLIYASNRRTLRTFGSDDLTYATIVAAFLQTLLQQRWQSERLHYQTQFDALTGLMNRSRFRAAIREASIAPEGCAIAIVDIIGFSEINRRFGTQTGDALLVEVAAGLAATAPAADFVGRLSGDTFGICLRGRDDEAALRTRLAPYLHVFDSPFSTGDRLGEDYVVLTARIGAAPANPDLTFNDLLTRADLAVKAARAGGVSAVVIDAGRPLHDTADAMGVARAAVG
jgi:diguanylate cyclase (GGDEF)-like protein